MNQGRGRKELEEEIRTKASHHVTNDIGDYNTGCRQLNIQALLSADKQCHQHCQKSQYELVFSSRMMAKKSSSCMKKSEDMYN